MTTKTSPINTAEAGEQMSILLVFDLLEAAGFIHPGKRQEAREYVRTFDAMKAQGFCDDFHND